MTSEVTGVNIDLTEVQVQALLICLSPETNDGITEDLEELVTEAFEAMADEGEGPLVNQEEDLDPSAVFTEIKEKLVAALEVFQPKAT